MLITHIFYLLHLLLKQIVFQHLQTITLTRFTAALDFTQLLLYGISLFTENKIHP
jgi:hypothetical protein